MTQIGKYWHRGIPYIGDHDIDPGQFQFWDQGRPYVAIYNAITSFSFKKIALTASGDIKKISNVAIASIKKVAQV